MKKLILILTISIMSENLLSQEKVNKFVGTKSCAMCHKSEKQGKQLEIWQKSKHADAYNTLLSEKALEIAKQLNMPVIPSESADCLSCHASGFGMDANLTEKNFTINDGVQCETCHNAGSNYKSLAVMKDKAKSIAGGLREYKDETEIEAHCKTCHNEKSPTYKIFDFKEQWNLIKHQVPENK